MVVQLATKGACSIPGLLLLMFLPQFYKQFIAAIKKLHLERGLRMSLKAKSELIHILYCSAYTCMPLVMSVQNWSVSFILTNFNLGVSLTLFLLHARTICMY